MVPVIVIHFTVSSLDQAQPMVEPDRTMHRTPIPRAWLLSTSTVKGRTVSQYIFMSILVRLLFKKLFRVLGCRDVSDSYTSLSAACYDLKLLAVCVTFRPRVVLSYCLKSLSELEKTCAFLVDW